MMIGTNQLYNEPTQYEHSKLGFEKLTYPLSDERMKQNVLPYLQLTSIFIIRECLNGYKKGVLP